MIKTEADYLETPLGQVYYISYGEGTATPLIVIHGGPGMPHNYLLPLKALATNRSVIFYDQLGCGQSARPVDPQLWTITNFVTELTLLIEHLGLKEVHLLGHSWGTILAVEYALIKKTGIKSLILASPCLSIPRWNSDAQAYIKKLPRYWRTILTGEREATEFSLEAYQEAVMFYYNRHVCRLKPWPALLLETMDCGNDSIYEQMWGETEFNATGSLANYDCTNRLEEIAVPTLFTCGRYDEASPETTTYYQSLITNAEMLVFEHSAHLPHIEEEVEYSRQISYYLSRIE